MNPSPSRHPPTLQAAWARIRAVDPVHYARTRNAINGAVSQLSPYITHGMVSLRDVHAGVAQNHPLTAQDKFVFELGWRAYFRHVWSHRGDSIFQSIHPGPLHDHQYTRVVPEDIRQASTGVNAIDMAIRELYTTGHLHNHARMWLASYMVHGRKVHWRAGADWLYGHLLDGDLASNHLSWQWVAGTHSVKPYLFNADNVARYAPEAWHSPGSVIDATYEDLALMAQDPQAPPPHPQRPAQRLSGSAPTAMAEPAVFSDPMGPWGHTPPHANWVQGRDVWLVHPWSLGPLPADLPPDTRVIGITIADFHRAWPWSALRWQFVGQRMNDITPVWWHGDAVALQSALQQARSVRCVCDPHLAIWLQAWATCVTTPELFPPINPLCHSFAQWWKRVAPHVPVAGLD